MTSRGFWPRYRRYLASERWRRKRRSYRRYRTWACGVCGVTKGLELHHKTYARLGRERLDDLIPLCTPHHNALHQFAAGSRLSLWRATTVYIDRARGHRK